MKTANKIIVRVTELNVGYVEFSNEQDAREWMEDPSYEDVKWSEFEGSTDLLSS